MTITLLWHTFRHGYRSWRIHVVRNVIGISLGIGQLLIMLKRAK